MKLFLSVPFSSRVNADGSVNVEYKNMIVTLLARLRDKGHEVFCALEFAEWKSGGMLLPEEELAHDLEQIDGAEAVIVLLEEVVSAGVQLENGYAFAKGKHITAYRIGRPAWSNIAFARLNKHEIVVVQSVDDFVAKVIAAYQSVKIA